MNTRQSPLARVALAVTAIGLTASSLTACDFTVSDDAKDQGKTTICQSSQTAIKQLDAGDETAKLAAILVRDNVKDGHIKKSADHIAKGKGTKAERQELIDWIKTKCK